MGNQSLYMHFLMQIFFGSSVVVLTTKTFLIKIYIAADFPFYKQRDKGWKKTPEYRVMAVGRLLNDLRAKIHVGMRR